MTLQRVKAYSTLKVAVCGNFPDDLKTKKLDLHNENRPVCAYKACTWCIGWISYALLITSRVRYNSAA